MRIENFLRVSPIFTLFVAQSEILGDFQRKMASEDVHFLEALILTGLFFEERPVRPKELASTFRVQKSNLSHALRSLERKHWIERKTLDKDARGYFFSLTREGKRKVPKLIKIFDRVQEKIERAPGSKRINQYLFLFMEIYKRVTADW